MLSKEFHQSKRAMYCQELPMNSVSAIFAGEAPDMNGDQQYLFSVNRNFYYLTGCDLEKCIYLVIKHPYATMEYLLIERPNAHKQKYEGKMFDIEQAKDIYGFEQVNYIEDMEDLLSRAIFGQNIQTVAVDIARWRMHFPFNEAQGFANKMVEVYPFLQVKNMHQFISDCRVMKSKDEIDAIRKACKITEEGVKNMLVHLKPKMKECEIEAHFDYSLKKNGVKMPAFWTIAGSGKNACTLHYVDNDRVMEDGDMILFDLGAEYKYYAADVSRTYPVNGKFTERQKQLYNIVLKSLDVALSLSKPGQNKNELQKISKQVMIEELKKINMIEKDEDIDRYYLHGSGHFIGLNTHDVGDNPDICLKKDMVFTLEPGLYFEEEQLGIRIEETLLVTEGEPEILSGQIPRTVEEIEAFMNGKG